MTQTILVVEDHPTLREQIALNLDVQGYEVLESPTGIDSLSLLADKGRQIDLILLDLGLPEMDGFEVLSRLKADPVLKTIPVLLCTARPVIDLIGGMNAGSDDYICKPFIEVELHRRIEVLLSRRSVGGGAA